MKIAVTGASGFIGTELLAELAGRKDTEIIGLRRSCSESEKMPDNQVLKWIDTDYEISGLTKALDGVDAVIHLAGVRGTSSDPADYAVNIDITENLLKAMQASGTGRIVFASTISVYDDVDLIPWKTDSPLKGRTAYGDSKIICEQLIRKWSEHADLSYGIVRIGQVLGKGEKRRGMMNVFLDSAKEHKQIKVIGRSEAKRQYIYVKDLVRILADTALAADDMIINAGMPNAYTNLEIAQIINRVFDNPVPIDYDDSSPETIRASWMDISGLKERFGYEPLDMEEAVRDLAEMK